MIKSRKLQLVMFLISACICASVLGAEPNEAKTELKFEISSEEQEWRVRAGPGSIIKRTGPIEPSHVAEVLIMGDNKKICYFYTYVVGSEGIKSVSKAWVFPGTEGVKMILQTSAGRSTSQKQREFVEKSNFFYFYGASRVPNYSQYRLYAVSEMDAKKMVEAFCEILTEKANATMREHKKLLSKTKEKIIEIKKELPEKQKQAKEAESKYKEVKNVRYSSLNEADAYEKAKGTMLQMGKMLDTLEIALAGIGEKLKAIEAYRNPEYLKDRLKYRQFPDEVMSKLDQMYVEQLIELRGAEARKKATLRICNWEKEFLDFYNQRANLEKEVDGLERNLSKSKKYLSGLEERLANPEPDMLPPKVYQDKVTIYPVRGGQ